MRQKNSPGNDSQYIARLKLAAEKMMLDIVCNKNIPGQTSLF
jgi:hypothetical protein